MFVINQTWFAAKPTSTTKSTRAQSGHFAHTHKVWGFRLVSLIVTVAVAMSIEILLNAIAQSNLLPCRWREAVGNFNCGANGA